MQCREHWEGRPPSQVYSGCTKRNNPFINVSVYQVDAERVNIIQMCKYRRLECTISTQKCFTKVTEMLENGLGNTETAKNVITVTGT